MRAARSASRWRGDVEAEEDDRADLGRRRRSCARRPRSVRQRPLTVHTRRSTACSGWPPGAAGQEQAHGRGAVVGVHDVERGGSRAGGAGRSRAPRVNESDSALQPRAGSTVRIIARAPAVIAQASGEPSIGGGGTARHGWASARSAAAAISEAAASSSVRAGAALNSTRSSWPHCAGPTGSRSSRSSSPTDRQQRRDDVGGADAGEAPELGHEPLRVHHGGRVRRTDHQVDHGALDQARVDQAVGLSTQSSPRRQRIAAFVAYCRYTHILRNVMTCPVTFPEDRAGADERRTG